MYNPCNKSSLCDSTVESRQDECERDYEEDEEKMRSGMMDNPEAERGTDLAPRSPRFAPSRVDHVKSHTTATTAPLWTSAGAPWWPNRT